MNIFRSLIRDFKAWRRGEVRIASSDLTGRIYAPKEQLDAGGNKARSKGILVMKRRVYRAETGVWEKLEELRTEM